MWKRIYQKTFHGIKRENVWNILIDINNWPTWHGDLDYCELKGDFKVGNHFMLKPKGINPVKILITEIKDGYSFTDCTIFFGAQMYDRHRIEETDAGVTLINELWVQGPLKWFWILLVAKNVAASVPDEMERLAQRAKKF